MGKRQGVFRPLHNDSPQLPSGRLVLADSLLLGFESNKKGRNPFVEGTLVWTALKGTKKSKNCWRASIAVFATSHLFVSHDLELKGKLVLHDLSCLPVIASKRVSGGMTHLVEGTLFELFLRNTGIGDPLQP